MELVFALLAAHALCDFVLQPEAMGRGKSRKDQLRTTAEPGFPPWYFWLASHGLVHGGAVYLVTGSWLLGFVESVLHSIIDHFKCEGRLTFHQDQACHLACKFGYLLFLL